MTVEETYECVRKWWKVGFDRANSCRYAIGTYKGEIVGVYEIDGWVPAGPDEIAEHPQDEGRWGFHGRPAEQMRTRLLGLDLSETVKGQNPIRYWRA